MVSTPQIIGQSQTSAESNAAQPPLQAPETAAAAADKPKPALDPTRYGDWEKNGRCIDF